MAAISYSYSSSSEGLLLELERAHILFKLRVLAPDGAELLDRSILLDLFQVAERASF